MILVYSDNKANAQFRCAFTTKRMTADDIGASELIRRANARRWPEFAKLFDLKYQQARFKQPNATPHNLPDTDLVSTSFQRCRLFFFVVHATIQSTLF
jgi:hypothetical protein